MPSLAMRSMFGVVYPINPLVKTLRFDCPMSSPQRIRMLGLLDLAIDRLLGLGGLPMKCRNVLVWQFTDRPPPRRVVSDRATVKCRAVIFFLRYEHEIQRNSGLRCGE